MLITPLIAESTSYVTIFKAWRHGETHGNTKGVITGGGPDDSDGTTALTEEGKSQAEELGKLLIESGELDVIYTSDLSRALDTTSAVLKAHKEIGKSIEQRLSKQLREILYGKFELSDGNGRNIAANALFQKMLEADSQQKTPEKELKDRFRFWKVHPLVSNEEVVPDEIVDVEDYIQRGETRPETHYQLWRRVYQDFIRIAQENPGKTVGISMHGGGLATLIDELTPNPKGEYLSPPYNSKEIKMGDTLIMPAATKIKNCALILFKYDSRNGKLELFAH